MHVLSTANVLHFFPPSFLTNVARFVIGKSRFSPFSMSCVLIINKAQVHDYDVKDKVVFPTCRINQILCRSVQKNGYTKRIHQI